MKTFNEAIAWLARNDDNDWVTGNNPSLSVSASALMHIYGKTRAEVINDLGTEYARWRLSVALFGD